MTETKVKDRCENEDEEGRMCTFGPGHKCKCQFRPYQPTEGQYEILSRGSSGNVVQRACVGLSEVASMKALSARSFIRLRYINSRAWDYQLTAAGRRLVIDRPR